MTKLNQLWDELAHSALCPALLPIAQAPAPIAARSRMKSIGKTPSLYNKQGEIFGFKDWVRKETKPFEAREWAKDERLGIGIRAKYLRAYDVDIDNAELVNDLLENVFKPIMGKGVKVVYRYRGNSPRILLPFVYEGECPKKRFKFSQDADGDMVELLGDGQFWVAYGRHPSGVDYEWEGDPISAPVLTQEDMEGIETVLTCVYGAETKTKSQAPRLQGETVEVEDPVADFLRENDWVLEEFPDRLYIRCPNEQEHTSGEEGDGSTVWFKAGTNGYEQGHFHCMHAHCSEITDDDFLKRIGCVGAGITVKDFEDVQVVEDKPLPRLQRKKNGNYVAELNNVVNFLMTKEYSHLHLAYDTFLQTIVIALPNDKRKRPIEDGDFVKLRYLMAEKGFDPIGRDLMRDAVDMVTSENKEDSAQDWLNHLPDWDGVPRCETFFADYCHAENNEVNRAISRYLWESMAGRILEPGVKADVMVVLHGNQGLRKSTMIATLVPQLSLYSEISLDSRLADIYRSTSGALVVEVPELAGMGKKDVESLKALLSATVDKFTNKYDRFARSFPRRYVFIGSTNQSKFLADEENRRFAVVEIPSTIDIERIEADRNQLWAEARALFLQHGIEQQRVEDLVKADNQDGKYQIEDPWLDKLRKYILASLSDNDELPSEINLNATELLEYAVKIRIEQAGPKDTRRIGVLMKRLGYNRKCARRNGLMTSSYVLDRKA